MEHSAVRADRTRVGRLGRALSIAGLAAVACLVFSSTARADVPIYLPWQAGTQHPVLQDNQSGPTHTSGNTEFAWDFTMDPGTAVLASAPGQVVRAAGGCGESTGANDPCNGGWGNYIKVCHDAETCTFYAHLRDIAVAEGDPVTQAQALGGSGRSGALTGESHLHFAVTRPADDVAIPHGFVESADPARGQVLTSQNGANTKPVFDPLQVFSLSKRGGVQVARGGPPVTVEVTSVYRGPRPIPCGDAHLGVVGDAEAPYRNDSAGPWPLSTWLSPNRVQIKDCIGELDPNESAVWQLSFLVPADAPIGLLSTGVWAPVWENTANGWADAQAEIKLDIRRAPVSAECKQARESVGRVKARLQRLLEADASRHKIKRVKHRLHRLQRQRDGVCPR